jgi:hypothetical protein
VQDLMLRHRAFDFELMVRLRDHEVLSGYVIEKQKVMQRKAAVEQESVAQEVV